MVISQLRFRKYLDRDNCTSPVDVAAVARLPNWQSLPAQLAEGECDILMIHREEGLIVGEIKSFGGGDYFSHQPESQQNQMIVNKVEKAVKVLNNQETALRRLVSDLNITITKTVIFPNITSTHLLRALVNTPMAQVSVSVSTSISSLFPSFTHDMKSGTSEYVPVVGGAHTLANTPIHCDCCANITEPTNNTPVAQANLSMSVSVHSLQCTVDTNAVTCMPVTMAVHTCDALYLHITDVGKCVSVSIHNFQSITVTNTVTLADMSIHTLQCIMDTHKHVVRLPYIDVGNSTRY